MPSKQQLGERIKRFRLERNLTLKEVELKAKVSATHVSEIAIEKLVRWYQRKTPFM